MASHGGYCDETAFFILNGEYQSLSSVPPNTPLNSYIRQYARLPGTKSMCREGGCGICVVSLKYTHPVTGEERLVSINSCMFPVYSCHGLEVTTVEGVGGKQKGYSPIQTRLAHFNGTQCGYCTPGWVMSMYSLIQSNPKASMKEIEDSFSGNLCRCTGYRPILDAFKSFASDRTQHLEQKALDIEDLFKCHSIENVRGNETDKKKTLVSSNSKEIEKGKTLTTSNRVMKLFSKLSLKSKEQWYKVYKVDEIFEIFEMVNGSYRLVAGNTAQGIIKDQKCPNVFIDINDVSFLKASSYYSGNWYLGANTTLSDAIVLLKAVAVENPKYFSYCKQLAYHLEKVGNTPVRNVGTLAGNLSIKHQWRAFQSDLFLILESVGALLSIRSERGAISVMSLPDYLETNMYKKVICQICLPPRDISFYVFKSYKVAPRAQNAIALVNAAFLFKLDEKNKCRVIERPRIIYGNINPNFIHACQTEESLVGRSLLDGSTLRRALDTLGREVRPDDRPTEPSPEYRRRLTLALFYRFVLSLCPSAVSERCRSGGVDLARPLSSGCQEYDTDSSRPPLYQPFPKLEALLQCSGEVEFVHDMPPNEKEVHCALVISKQGPAALKGVNPCEALKMPGVLAFFTAKDIPGENTFTTIDPFVPEKEELFASKRISYAGQPLGVIVAETQVLADSAAEKVCILYGEKQKPMLDVKEVVKIGDTSRITLTSEKDAATRKGDIKKVVKGEAKLGTQYHFTMETISCVVRPVDGELDIFATSQWMAQAQESVALLLNIPENKINMKVRRIGGGYGQKITRCNIVTCACSLVAHLLHRPVRSVTKLETVMETIGKRWPCWFNYEAGVNDKGEIQYCTTNMYNDAGTSANDPVSFFSANSFTNVYDPSTWSLKLYNVKTDKASTSWMRAPGTVEAVTMADTIIEHIAKEVAMDPMDVRMANIDKKYPIIDMISKLKEKSDYEARKVAVQDFNKKNLWKKRGMSVVQMRYPMDLLGSYHVVVVVYRNDGSVAICHGGIEMGQGINTKAAQVCASTLGITLDQVVVKPTNNLTCANDKVTGGSFTTESVCYAVEQCCIELNKRLEPIREKLHNPSWQELVKAAFEVDTDLNVCKMFSSIRDYKNYQIFGACVIEVEVDILTGEYRCIRADVMEDAGKSLNPDIDVGQIEGAFVMGLGYFTSEEVKYDPECGRVITNRTLTYKIPGAKDVPADFRVYVLKNGDNPLGVLRTKAIGEPPLCLANSVMFAIRDAMGSVRRDLGLPDTWLQMDAPFTAENVMMSCGVDPSFYCLKSHK